MAAERCPLCQSKLKNGECLSCGYRPPDEGDISALYNYDPTDYPQPQQDIREIIPDVQMEEIYPGRPEMPDIKVMDDNGNTVGRYGTGANQEAWRQAKQVRQQQQAEQAQQVQQALQAQQAKQAKQNDPNPYADNGNFTPYQAPPAFNNPASGNSSSNSSDFGEFIKSYWVFLLIAFLVPVGGIVLFFTFKDKVDAKYRWLFIAVMVLRIFLL